MKIFSDATFMRGPIWCHKMVILIIPVKIKLLYKGNRRITLKKVVTFILTSLVTGYILQD